ncbi:MAG: hypothetical protein V9F04_10615 [Dermatophilaceae bacterium]
MRREDREKGQISVLILGLFVIAALLIIGGVDVTAAQLARVRLIDAADAMALDAADALDERGGYAGGLAQGIALTSATVVSAAEAHLAARPAPDGVSAWRLLPGTGTADGRSATVALEAVVDLPITGGVLEALGRTVTIQVQSKARAPLQP